MIAMMSGTTKREEPSQGIAAATYTGGRPVLRNKTRARS